MPPSFNDAGSSLEVTVDPSPVGRILTMLQRLARAIEIEVTHKAFNRNLMLSTGLITKPRLSRI